MSNREQKVETLIQLNRHLREWNNNIALEIRKRYLLITRHQSERRALVLKGVKFGEQREKKLSEQTKLGMQHLLDTNQMVENNGKVRAALEERHSQEKAYLRQQF